MIICLVFMAFYLFGLGDNATVTLGELIINVIWWIFWLSTAAVLSNIVQNINNGNIFYYNAGKFRASCAFAWFTWALWTLSVLLSVKEVKERNNGGGTMPTSSTGNVALV